MSSRAASSEAERRQELLRQIAEKRAQAQSTQQAPARQLSAPAAGHHHVANDKDNALHELEDFSSPEKQENSQPNIDKIKGLTRLRQAGAATCARPDNGLDDLVASVQKLAIQRPASSKPAQSSMRALHELQMAAQQELPSSSDSEGEDAPYQPRDGAHDAGSTSSSGSESEAASLEDEDSDDEHQPMRHLDAPATTTAPRASSVPSSQILQLAGGLVLEDTVDKTRTPYTLPKALWNKLYPHQIEGVKWLWSLQCKQRGGILGDDMGLGKTMQCSAFVAGLLASGLAKRAMVVAPKTLLLHWEKELQVCGLGNRVHNFYGGAAGERNASLRTAMGSKGGVLLTTYGMVLHNAGPLSTPPASGSSLFGKHQDDEGHFKWDVMVLDEGHKIKNPKMKLVQELRRLPVRISLVISGTPIQNNLQEMHALFDFCCEGLLGDSRTFKKAYANPITAGQDRGATGREREVGSAVAAELRRMIAPYFLRREKKDVLGGGAAAESGQGSGSSSASTGASGTIAGPPRPQQLHHKNDLVVWLRMKPLQRAVYTAFLHSDSVKRALNETDSPLAALTVLKKICDHPALLSESAASKVIAGGQRWAHKGKRNGAGSDSEASGSDSEEEAAEGGANIFKSIGLSQFDVASQLGGAGVQLDGAEFDKQLMQEMGSKAADTSCKTVFVLALLDDLESKGHRTLLFSQSRVMLDILQAAIVARGLKFCRIDGNVVSAEDRQAEVARFQAPGSRIPVFLLTSQVGGLGLTLTAADRVVILDPSWNPAVDNQAVDRAYRIGQQRDVVVYRLITCGTVEEKIYRKQVFKGGLSRTGTEDGVQFRYFTGQQLRDLFTVTPEGLETSATQKQLHDMHARQRKASEEVKEHLQFLAKLEGFAGVSDHDLLFTQRPDDAAPSAEQGRQYVAQLEAAASTTGGSGSTGARSRGAGGWKGEQENSLSALFSKTLSIGVAGSAASAQSLKLASQVRKVEEIARNVASQKTTVATYASKMADGGAKIRAKLVALEAELSQEQAVLVAMQQGESQQQPAGRPLIGVGAGVGMGPGVGLTSRPSSGASAGGAGASQLSSTYTLNSVRSAGSSGQSMMPHATQPPPPSALPTSKPAAPKPPAPPAPVSKHTYIPGQFVLLDDSPPPTSGPSHRPEAPTTSQGSQGSRARPAFGAGLAARGKADALPTTSVGSVSAASFMTADEGASDGDGPTSPSEVRSVFKPPPAAARIAVATSEVIDLTDD